MAGGSVSAVTVIVTTFNEEKNIGACLRSIEHWCDEIFIVDSGSEDRTVEISKEFTEKIFFNQYIDHATQFHWAFKNLPISNDWALVLDADNVVTNLLKRQITDMLKRPEESVNGYFVKHEHFFQGQSIRGLKPFWLRLVRHEQAKVETSELVDFRFSVQGKTKKLSGAIIENNRNEDSIDFWIDKHQKFSTRMAVEEVLRKSNLLNWELGPRLFGTSDERMVWFKEKWYLMPLYVRPFLYFFYRYFFKLGLLDGVKGFIYHFLQSFWFRLIVDIKISHIRSQLLQGKLNIQELSDTFSDQSRFLSET